MTTHPDEFGNRTPDSPDAVLETPRGAIHLRRRCSPEFIQGLTVDEGFSNILRPSRAKRTLSQVAARPGGNVTLATTADGALAGYVMISRPEPTRWQQRVMHERWEQCAAIQELGSIEVSRNFRRLGIAEKMMQVALAGSEYDDSIVIAQTIRWHWDLETAGGNAFVYREWLLGLMERHGFTEFGTDDSEVRADPANALIARIGPACPQDHIQHFHSLRIVSRRLAAGKPAGMDLPSDVTTAPPATSVARVLVGDYMNDNPATLAPSDTLQQAWKRMRERRVRHLPVLEDGRLVGVLTDRDIREAMPSPDIIAENAEVLSFLAMVKVEERMARQVAAAGPTTAIEEAAALLLERRIGCLPVVEDGRLVGILTQTDMLRALVDVLAEHARWLDSGDPI